MSAVPERSPARLVGLGTANPPRSFTQVELLDLMAVTDRRVRAVFANGAIERRYLDLPVDGGSVAVETQGELLARHRLAGVELGCEAVRAALKRAEADVDELGYLCCVTSTGFLTPGFSALVAGQLGAPASVGRLDVVGMGCNAGLNGLGAVVAWAERNPGRLAVLACIEVCSAAYVADATMRTAVVNSLFGDGAAAVAVRTDGAEPGPAVVSFTSYLIPDSGDAMRYDWDDGHGKFSFFLDRQIPYVIGANAQRVVDTLLLGQGIGPRDVDHWVVHSGGKKVIDAIRINLGLTQHDLRHTSGVLRDFGNLSSGSFLFSLERLLDEGVARPGDVGVLMTMGPGCTIEAALVRW